MLEGSAMINLFFTAIKLFPFRKFLMQTVEAVARRRSVRKSVLKALQNSQKNTRAKTLFLNEVAVLSLSLQKP